MSAPRLTAKRVLDVVGAILGLVLATPVLLVTAALISLVDGAPFLFWQRRLVVRIGWSQERFALRWTVRPGLTGLAQLASPRRCSARASWLYDRAYVRHCGVATDLGILARSALVPILGKRGMVRARRRLARRPT